MPAAFADAALAVVEGRARSQGAWFSRAAHLGKRDQW